MSIIVKSSNHQCQISKCLIICKSQNRKNFKQCRNVTHQNCAVKCERLKIMRCSSNSILDNNTIIVSKKTIDGIKFALGDF